MSTVARSFRLRDDQHTSLATLKRVEDRSAPSAMRLALDLYFTENAVFKTKKLAEAEREKNSKRERSEDGTQMEKCTFYITADHEKDMNTVQRNTGLSKATQARDALDLYFRRNKKLLRGG